MSDLVSIRRVVGQRTVRALLAGTIVLLGAIVLLTYFAPWGGSSGAASLGVEQQTLILGEARSPGVNVEPGVPRREPAILATSGPEMALTLTAGGFCSAGQCYAATSSTFTLAVEVLGKPAADYILVQTFLDYGVYDPTANEDGAGPDSCGDGFENGIQADGADRMDDDCVTVDLIYNPSAEPGGEIVWEDLSNFAAVRGEPGPGLLAHGGLTGAVPPLLESNYEGVIIQIQMTCPATASQIPIALLLYDDPIALTSGTVFVEPDQTKTLPKVSPITMNCVDPQAHPGDTDGDGCSDARENGTNPALGGDRDWLNPWDFYDVAIAGGVPGTDGVIDLPNDVLGVITRVGSAPGPPYDVRYDRGAWVGLNSWTDTAPPDGVIDSDTDIDGVFAQYGDNCT